MPDAAWAEKYPHSPYARKLRQTVPVPSILVTEDQTDIRELLYHLLQGNGFNVVFGETVEDAFSILSSPIRPDLALVDIGMVRNDVGGLDLLQQVRVYEEENELDPIPFVMLTALAQGYTVELATQWGADAVIPKPFRTKQLIGTIRGLLEEHDHGA